MTRDQLLFVALFVLIPLLNFLGGLLRKRMQRKAEPDVAQPPAAASLPTPVTDLDPRVVSRARSSTPPLRPAAPPIARRRSSRLRPSDVRRGVVLMAILRSCPGLERPVREG